MQTNDRRNDPYQVTFYSKKHYKQDLAQRTLTHKSQAYCEWAETSF